MSDGYHSGPENDRVRARPDNVVHQGRGDLILVSEFRFVSDISRCAGPGPVRLEHFAQAEVVLGERRLR